MHELSLAAETIGRIGFFPITNTLLTAWLAVALLCFIAFLLTRRIRIIPSPLQTVAEGAFEGLLSLMNSVTQDQKKTEQFAPLVLTIFFFILAANWMGIFPGVGALTITHDGHTVPLLRSAFTDLNNTLALALIAVIATHVAGIASLGFFAHIGKFISFKSPIRFFVGIIEIISEFAKILSFSVRLFGNIFAGEVLLLVMGILIPVVLPVPFLGFELFVGFMQALVFALLALAFLTIATQHPHELR